MTNKIIMGLGILSFIAMLMPMNADAISFHRSPENITANFFITRDNYTHNSTFGITLENIDTRIVDDISFESPYVLDYTPKGAHMDAESHTTFTLTIGISTIEEATSISTIINVTGQPEDSEDRQVVGKIPLYIIVDADIVPLEQYIFKKCFMQDEHEYCAEINISELVETNVTVINLTQENHTFNVMLPYNLTTEYFNKYEETLKGTANRMDIIANAVLNYTMNAMRLENQKNRNYENAFMIDSYMKAPDNPLWFEISPVNTLHNLTGLDKQQMEDALAVLFKEGKIVQKDEEEFKVIPLKNGGTLTTIVKKIFIASRERVEQERITSTSMMLMYFALIILFSTIGAIMLIKYRFSRQPSWGSGEI